VGQENADQSGAGENGDRGPGEDPCLRFAGKGIREELINGQLRRSVLIFLGLLVPAL
jgi:hypothetical protein